MMANNVPGQRLGCVSARRSTFLCRGTALLLLPLLLALLEEELSFCISGRSFRRRGEGVSRLAFREDLLTQGLGVGGTALSSTDLSGELSPISQGDVYLNTAVFIAFCVPFLYASWEFWRRIAFGQPFGTGEDQIVFEQPGEGGPPPLIMTEAAGRKVRPVGKVGKVTIGMDSDTNRGRMVLGQDALWVAYALMFLAAASVAVAGVMVYPVFSGQVPMRS